MARHLRFGWPLTAIALATTQERNYDAVRPFMSRDGKFPAACLEAVRGSFLDLGILPSEPDLSKYVTERFLPAP
jgi:hypothetical protein